MHENIFEIKLHSMDGYKDNWLILINFKIIWIVQCCILYKLVYVLLSPNLCFISILYLNLYVLGDDALIS